MNEVDSFFRRLELKILIQWRERYEHLLQIEFGTEPLKINPVTGKKMEPHKMPWMIPAWKSGLAVVNEVIEEKQKSELNEKN